MINVCNFIIIRNFENKVISHVTLGIQYNTRKLHTISRSFVILSNYAFINKSTYTFLLVCT